MSSRIRKFESDNDKLKKKKILDNGEVQDRDWLVYSKDLDKLFCFCCKIFKKGYVKGGLVNEGYADWTHIAVRLQEHEVGLEHKKNWATWYELRSRLNANKTIDHLAQKQLKKEKDQWKNVLLRILIFLLASSIRSEIVKKVRQAKYFSVILDCPPDVSHQEQMSLILRYVDLTSSSVVIEESFLGFINVNVTTGQGLFDVLLQELKSLDLDVDNVRGDFFGVTQRIYTIFAHSTKRWQILKDNVKGLTLKSMSSTRWESRVDSVRAIRFQISYLRSSMSQERLNGLALLAIENDHLEKVAYEDLIEDFVSKNSRRLLLFQ
uniref:TTF-type domain-containing protein n=1 Tax=Kalanchoe fedtschenkoi TaxID=63787 RepID=A0A7N0TCQ3_KALFE